MSLPPQKISSVLVYGSVAPGVCNACVLHLTGMANALARRGLDVTLMAPRGKADDPLMSCLDEQVKFVGFAKPTIFSRTLWTLGPVFSLLQFNRVLIEQRPELLYVRTGLLTWPLHWLANRRGIPSVAEHNGIISVELSHKRFWKILAPLATGFQLLSCRFATWSRAVTNGMKRQLIELGADADKVFVLGNGTDVEGMRRAPRGQSLAALGLAEDKFYVGFLGSLSWWQGVHTLVDAVAIAQRTIPELHLLIGGDGSELPNLKAQAAALGVSEQVSFLGYVGAERRVAVLSAMDIATLPACAERNKEQGVSPLKVRDYAAMSGVILAADLPGLEEVAEAEALVLHVPDDALDLAQKMIELYRDQDRREKLARNSRAYADRHYSWAVIGERLLATLEARG